jgi:hypothetical protein
MALITGLETHLPKRNIKQRRNAAFKREGWEVKTLGECLKVKLTVKSKVETVNINPWDWWINGLYE